MMRRLSPFILFLLFVLPLSGQDPVWTPQDWPVLKTYDQNHLAQIALPLGGIGTGSVCLGGRGELRDWEIMNVPGKNYSTVTTGNNAPFFAIWYRTPRGESQTRLLSGPLYDSEYLHYEGRPVNHHGMPRFAKAEFQAAFPFGQAILSDDSMPVKVRIKGFNPFIPGDSESSGLPVAILTYEVTNTSPETLEVSVAGSIRNFIGKDGSKFTTDWKGDQVPTGAKKNRNTFRQDGGLSGIHFTSDGVDTQDPAWGNMALVTMASQDAVSYRTSTLRDDWSNAILGFWDDFSEDGRLEEMESSGEDDPMASLSVTKTIESGQSAAFTFLLTWNFPNRKAWSKVIEGNYYSTRYPDAWETARQVNARLPELERRTLAFVNAVLGSSLPEAVKEAALFNLAVYHSQTVFRIKDGHFMGWEGVMDRFGSCQGSCTHVWNYETATAFLFQDLALTMRDVEFRYALRDNGLMNFRASLPLLTAGQGQSAAADGQMGCIMKFYREWQLSGDTGMLRDYWPSIKSALSYCWVEGGWDADRDGVMEGSQHNTMDVNYQGPNPQMGFWYLGALKAASRMAKAVSDKAFEKECLRLFDSGSRWIEENLFNGEYYEHRITRGGKLDFLDLEKDEIPSFQLGRGCLVDQLVGQYMADLTGLGDLGDRAHQLKTLESIMRYNFVEDFSGHFNNMRSYVLGDEAGLLMASWPKGRLKVPFPYFAEVMTGFEYTAATGMVYAGMRDEALKVVRAIRSRFDGARRNPFSEPECGHHYARSMASWSLMIALSGFQYSGVDQSLSVTGNKGRYFWSNGRSWGTFEVTGTHLTVKVIEGSLDVRSVKVGGRPVKGRLRLQAGESQSLSVE